MRDDLAVPKSFAARRCPLSTRAQVTWLAVADLAATARFDLNDLRPDSPGLAACASARGLSGAGEVAGLAIVDMIPGVFKHVPAPNERFATTNLTGLVFSHSSHAETSVHGLRPYAGMFTISSRFAGSS